MYIAELHKVNSVSLTIKNSLENFIYKTNEKNTTSTDILRRRIVAGNRVRLTVVS